MQLVDVQVDPTAQPIWLLENATASVVVVGADAGGVGSGLGDSVACSDDGDAVDGTTVDLATELEQPASNATAAMAATPAILCMTGERVATTTVIVFRCFDCAATPNG